MTQRPESPYRRFFTEDRSFAQLVRRRDKAGPEEKKDAGKQAPPQDGKKDDSEEQE